eukprot:scaffold106644_cov20-Tisochrysis_lutea.AAC.4
MELHFTETKDWEQQNDVPTAELLWSLALLTCSHARLASGCRMAWMRGKVGADVSECMDQLLRCCDPNL